MKWERRFRFSSTAFCRLLFSLKHFVHLWICRHLSAQSYRTWLHIIYDSDSFGDYCNVPLPFYNCSVVPKLMSREGLRCDWQSEEQTQRTICKKLHYKYYCTLTVADTGWFGGEGSGVDLQWTHCFTRPYCVNQSLSYTCIYEETSLSLVEKRESAIIHGRAQKFFQWGNVDIMFIIFKLLTISTPSTIIFHWANIRFGEHDYYRTE